MNTWKVIETNTEDEITSMVQANLHKYPFSMLFQCSFIRFSLYFQWKLNFQWYFPGRLCMGQYLLEESTESIVVFQLFEINWWNNLKSIAFLSLRVVVIKKTTLIQSTWYSVTVIVIIHRPYINLNINKSECSATCEAFMA